MSLLHYAHQTVTLLLYKYRALGNLWIFEDCKFQFFCMLLSYRNLKTLLMILSFGGLKKGPSQYFSNFQDCMCEYLTFFYYVFKQTNNRENKTNKQLDLFNILTKGCDAFMVHLRNFIRAVGTADI